MQHPLPAIVSAAEWQAAHEEFLAREKELTRLRDALNAERRRLPVVKIEQEYTFQGPDGPARLVDLFEGRSQLILYHFMYGPDDAEACSGCSMFVDNLGHPAHLHARDTSRVLVSSGPLEKLLAFKRRMGWDIPWYSCYGTDFNRDMGVATVEGEGFGLNVFLRAGEDVYRTYFTRGRGVEYLGTNWSFLDITPYGRRETWEDSPEGWPQSEPYVWWDYHDSYAD